MALGVPDSRLEEAVLGEEENLHPYAEPLPEGAGFFRRFVKSDHPYVLLGTSAVAAFSLACTATLPLGAAGRALTVACLAWLVFSAVALVAKAVLRGAYRSRCPLARATLRKPLRYLSYLVWACAIALFCLGPVAHFVAPSPAPPTLLAFSRVPSTCSTTVASSLSPA